MMGIVNKGDQALRRNLVAIRVPLTIDNYYRPTPACTLKPHLVEVGDHVLKGRKLVTGNVVNLGRAFAITLT